MLKELDDFSNLIFSTKINQSTLYVPNMNKDKLSKKISKDTYFEF